MILLYGVRPTQPQSGDEIFIQFGIDTSPLVKIVRNSAPLWWTESDDSRDNKLLATFMRDPGTPAERAEVTRSYCMMLAAMFTLRAEIRPTGEATLYHGVLLAA
jgi:hypothetical protein